MALTVNGQNSTSFPAGSNLSLLCSAESSPAAQLRWAIGGVLVGGAGPVLELPAVSRDQSGDYSCLAFNGRTNASSSVTKRILVTGGSVCKGDTCPYLAYQHPSSCAVVTPAPPPNPPTVSPQGCQDVNSRPPTRSSPPCCCCCCGDPSNCQAHCEICVRKFINLKKKKVLRLISTKTKWKIILCQRQ